MEMKDIIRAWSLSKELNYFNPPASEDELQTAESKIGRKLPDAMRELYLFSNGGDLLQGNLQIFKLMEPDPKKKFVELVGGSDQLREWHYEIPKEVLTFAHDGSEDHFGIWLPETHNPKFPCPVLEIGQISNARSMAIQATDFIPFLAARTAYFLLPYVGTDSALDALGIPGWLRAYPDNAELYPLLRVWADPWLPDPDPDCYEKAYDRFALADIFQSKI